MNEADRFKKASSLFYADCFSDCLNLSQREEAESLEEEWEEQRLAHNPPALGEGSKPLPLPSANPVGQEMWQEGLFGCQEGDHAMHQPSLTCRSMVTAQDTAQSLPGPLREVWCQAETSNTSGDLSGCENGLPSEAIQKSVSYWGFQPEPIPWGQV